MKQADLDRLEQALFQANVQCLEKYSSANPQHGISVTTVARAANVAAVTGISIVVTELRAWGRTVPEPEGSGQNE